MEQKIKTLLLYQWYCILPAIILSMSLLRHSHAVDAQSAQNSLILHIGMWVVGIIAVIVLQLKKQALKEALKQENGEKSGVTPGIWPPPPNK